MSLIVCYKDDFSFHTTLRQLISRAHIPILCLAFHNSDSSFHTSWDTLIKILHSVIVNKLILWGANQENWIQNYNFR